MERSTTGMKKSSNDGQIVARASRSPWVAILPEAVD